MVTESALTDAPPTDMRRPSRRRWWGRVLSWGAIVGIVLGIGAVTSTVLFPEQVERVYGSMQKEVGAFRIDVLGEVPRVTLGASGGLSELNRCDGTFTEMRSYEHEGVPPIWAAHNNCGGDVVLPWRVGTEVIVVRDGEEQRFVVADVDHSQDLGDD